ncbi:MAG: hypothetical protein WDN03_09825 [Rhizomicrobium sp.]
MAIDSAADLTAEDLEDEAYEIIDESKDAVILFVRERPMTALIATFLAGVVVGKLIL